MLQWLIGSIFSCSHERMTFPVTPKKSADTYVVCLECGREFAYDWSRMRIGSARPARVEERKSIETVNELG